MLPGRSSEPSSGCVSYHVSSVSELRLCSCSLTPIVLQGVPAVAWRMTSCIQHLFAWVEWRAALREPSACASPCCFLSTLFSLWRCLTLTLAVHGVFLCAWSNHVVEQYKWNMVLSSTMEGCILPAAWHAWILLLGQKHRKVRDSLSLSTWDSGTGEVLLTRLQALPGSHSDVCTDFPQGLHAE